MELQFPQPLPQLDRGGNREPERDTTANPGGQDAGDGGEGNPAPGPVHGIG